MCAGGERASWRVIGVEIKKIIDVQLLGGLWVIEMGVLSAAEK